MKIKVCGLKHVNNLKSILKLSPDFIGLIFYPLSERYVSANVELADYLRSIKSVRKVGVFVNASEDFIFQNVSEYALDMVQLHGNETSMYCKRIAKNIDVIKAFHINSSFEFNKLKVYEPYCNYFLFESPSPLYGGSGKQFDWQQLVSYSLDTKFLLSGGIGPDDTARLKEFQHHRLEGIDINSRYEIAPGIKDVKKIKKLIYEFRDK